MGVLLQFKKKWNHWQDLCCFGGDTSFIFPSLLLHMLCFGEVLSQGAKGGRRIFHISTQIVLLTFDDVGMDACVIWKLKYSGV